MRTGGEWLDLLIPPEVRADPRRQLRHRGIAKSLLAISAVVLALFLVYLLVRRDLTRQELLLFAAAILSPTLGVLFIRATGRIGLGLFFTNLAGIGIVAVWCGLTGGITSVALPWFLPNLFLLSTFGNWRMVVATTGILLASLLFLFVATLQGWLPPNPFPAALTPIFNLLSMASSVAVLLIATVAVTGEREKSKRHLKEARDAAEAASRAKSAFLTSMSHELRTPLNAVMISAELLKEDRDPPLSPGQLQFVEQVAQGSEALLGLVNQVLELSAIEAGAVTLKVEAVALREALAGALAVIAPLAQRQDVRIACDPESIPELRVRADPVGLRSVLINLLSNAVKFNSRPGEIFVAAHRAGDGPIRIEIRDTGLGIPGHLREDAFQPFNRLGAEGSRIGGTGLGLSISDHLVRMMEGRMGYESVPGHGSTFWVELPAAAAAPSAAAAPAEAPAPLPPPAPLAVLVAEDHPVNQQLLLRTLERWGHRVTVVANGAEAVAAVGAPELGRHRFDVVLMDLLMPEMDGLEATRRIRRSEADSGAHLAIVAVTACAQDSDRQACFEAGMDDYLAKPFKPDDLATILRRIAGQAAPIRSAAGPG